MINDISTIIADFSSDDFVKIPTFPHSTQKSVMPVVAFRKDQVKLLGTCFAISNHGLVLTARHVLDDAIELAAEAHEWLVGVLYVSEPTPNDDVPDLLGGLIPANRIHTSNEFDIGLMHLDLPVRKDTGAYLSTPALTISPALPHAGDLCFTLGYHDMEVASDSDKPNNKTIQQSYSASKGAVEEIHFPRRDKIKLSFPCFRTSMRHDHGMSGAPVVSKEGGVIGVVCSGIEGQAIYYVSLIGMALFFQIDTADEEGNIEKAFLYDFIVGGTAGTDETIDQLKVHRHKGKLEISFGMLPTFTGIIET